MTKPVSKLAKGMDDRQQKRVPQNKKNLNSPKMEVKDIEASIQAPTRIHEQRIQRAQYYSGDA